MSSTLAAALRYLQKLSSRSNTLIFGSMVFAAAMLFWMWFGYSTRLATEQVLAWEAAEENNENIATIVAANLEEVLGRALLYARIADTVVQGNQSSRAYLNPIQAGDHAYLRATVFDRDGTLLYSSANQRDEPELAPLVQALRGGAAEDDLPLVSIGSPTHGVGNAWRLPLVVPLPGASGPSGFYGAIVDLGYFLVRYRDVNLGAGGQIAVLDLKNMPLAVLKDGSLAAMSAANTRTGKDFLLYGAGGRQDSRLGEASQVIALRTLSEYPVSVVVSAEASSVLGSLREQHAGYLSRTVAFTIVILMMTFGAVLILGRQQRLHEAVVNSEQEKRKLISLLESEKNRAFALASHDDLTGIPNRRLFREMAAAELKRAKRNRNLYALLFFDLDKFKLINDTLGHSTGDLLLKEVAARLRGGLRAYDLVARLGGDEFVVLLSNMSSEEDVALLANKLVKRLSETYLDLEGNDVNTSPSVGIAIYPRDGGSIEEMMANADKAMYSAKQKGRGLYRFYDASLNATTARRYELSARFTSAIEQHEFQMHYQPRVDLDTLRIVGLEALVRWQHPDHGLIFPGDFISVAEEQGYIIKLGQWIIDACCRQVASWQARGMPVVPIAINVSAQQLNQEHFPEEVVATLARHGVLPDMIEIEITETCFIDDPALAAINVEKLAAAGIKAAIDDYGTGFSGLSRLKELPIRTVKIDRSFIRDIRNDTSDAFIVSSTISLAHNLGLTVVAEGVESRAQLVHLKAAGCDEVQGFYLYRPAPAADIELVLQQKFFTFPET